MKHTVPSVSQIVIWKLHHYICFLKCQIMFGRKRRHWLSETFRLFNLHFFLISFFLYVVSAHPACLRAIVYHLVNPLLGEAHLL